MVITNFLASIAAETTPSADQVRMRLILQLISGISRLIQKLLKYFNGTAISTSFTFPLFGLFPLISVLNLNYSESVIIEYGSSP